ncbi:MAG: HD domain-containing protein [Thermosipho sp. (in: Bacteria)]|nr:HD domain-containing protein [Thermosipho sp. (in: thermotogales)]
MKKFEIRDPVYGFVELNELEKDIVNTPVFQRLRRIRQLGLTDYVYPGATHTRFEHSLGVMHLATRMYDSIVNKEENIRLLEDCIGYNKNGINKDRQLLRLAALLHDIGHAPFSHVSEEVMPSKSDGEKYKHEDYTVKIILEKLSDVINNHPYNQANYNVTAKEVAALIQGNVKILGPRSFWKILISSQLDADRCDYLLRDSLHIGVKYGVYDIDRLLVSLTLIKDPESGVPILGIDRGGWHVAEALIIARYQMFTQVYYHKTRRAYDYMLKEAMKASINEFPSPEKIDEFIKYDDYYVWLLMSQNGNNQMFERIMNRNHLRMIAETKENPFDEEKDYINQLKLKLERNGIWYWEDTPSKAKSWYNLNSTEEVKIIDGENVSLLSDYSVIVKSLQKQFSKSRIYVYPEDKKKAEELKREVVKWKK